MTDGTIAERRAVQPLAERGLDPAGRRPSSLLFPLASVLGGTGLIALHAGRYGSWIADDAAITFAYARSVSGAYGPVLQPDAEPVEGFSNPAWLALLTIGRLIGLFDRGTIFGIPDYVLFPKAVGLLFCAGILVAFYAAVCKVTSRPTLATSVSAVILAAIPSFVVWCFSGLENSLFALAAVWLAVVIFRAVLDNHLLSAKVALLSGALVTLAALTRPDGLIYAAAYPLVVLIYLQRPMLSSGVRHVLLHVASFGLPCGAYLIWRYLTFGRLVPNTAVAKSQSLPTVGNFARIGELVLYVGVVPVLTFAVLVGVVLAGRSPLRTGLAALLVPLALAVSALVILGKDWMGELRFATPIWPLAILIGTLMVFQVASNASARGRSLLSIGVVAAIMSSGFMFVNFSNEFRATPTYPVCVVADRLGRSFNGYANILGVHHGSLLLPDLGGSALTSRLHLVDMAGLAERRIAEFHRDNDKASLRDYVFEVVKPTFIHSFGPWNALTRIPQDPRMTRDYIAIYAYPESPYEGDWVRKDVVPGAERLQAAQNYAIVVMLPVTSARWASPLSHCGPTLRVGQTPATWTAPRR